MAKLYDAIDERWTKWIGEQRVFFVATAPRADDGRINLSPKGLDSFAILGPNEVAYLDLIGSGAETLAHLRENGRITLMFCAFEGPPMILRLQGTGEGVEPGDADWDALRAHFADRDGVRSIIRVRVDRIADSCGYGVPVYEYRSERDQLPKWAANRGPEGLVMYQLDNNLESIDGLPALRGETLRAEDDSA